MEWSDSSSETSTHNKTELVIGTFNCRGWDSHVIKNLIEDMSAYHSRKLILACQETWLYTPPTNFQKELEDQYHFVHESAMSATEYRKGRPFGGIAFVVSKSIAFKIKYLNCRCLSILLTNCNILISNIYLPANDSRKSAQENRISMAEALGHLDAAHELAVETVDGIVLGDFNVAPEDTNSRSSLVKESLHLLGYDLHSQLNYPTHNSGRTLDGITTTNSISSSIQRKEVVLSHNNSDHYPVIAWTNIKDEDNLPLVPTLPQLCWKKASEKALLSYSNLCQKKCNTSLRKFQRDEIDGTQLYAEVVNNMESAAQSCIPKSRKNNERKRHNVPMWRERMASHKTEVDYWLQLQFLNGGPNHCPSVIRQQLRLAKSRYRFHFRALRREIEINVAETITLYNYYQKLSRKPKAAKPAMIDGHSRRAQPEMWRQHFRTVFHADETPYRGDITNDIDRVISNDDITHFNHVNLNEMNSVLSNINSDKSYQRHHHWECLSTDNHSAKLCLLEIFKYFINNVLHGNSVIEWDFFLTHLDVIPKKGKKDLSLKKSWRPISIGTSENWVLEKVLLNRLLPYLKTNDCQFGYKSSHSTSHAIELIRTIERGYDTHCCLLDASSAFDNISWIRIKNQLIKRSIPFTLVKIVICQLYSTKISICKTAVIFPRNGVKQGGVLSGIIFAACYDDLAFDLERTGVGVLIKTLEKSILISVIIYADDVLLIASSPYGLQLLINITVNFAALYGDITFNPGKSCILRLGMHNNPAVSVCNIPVAECHDYLGVEIGRQANPQRSAAARLYRNTNLLLAHNRELRKCSTAVKNVCINSYGNVYCLENLSYVTSEVRKAHRYMTKRVHTDWTTFADLDGPNIRSRRLYSVFELDSIEVLHRRRRNNFLLKAASHSNKLIRYILGGLDRITG